MPISKLSARQVYDCRGFPTIEVDLVTDQGLFQASVPCGESTGKHETLDLRDRDPWAWNGRGCLKVMGFINNILAPAICSKPDLSEVNQQSLDKILLELDGTENKSRYGANAVLGVSMAICRAGAAKRGIPLYKHIANLVGNKKISIPIPLFNVINGGRHSGNQLAIQQFQIIPRGAKTFADAMQMGTEIYHHLGDIIDQKYGQYACYVGDEGGFTPDLLDNEECLRMINTSIEQCAYSGKVFIGLDIAASNMYKKGLYDLDFKNPKSQARNYMSSEQLMELYKLYALKYPVVSLTDPYEQDRWDEWAKATAGLAHRNMQIVGDDLLATNPRRVQTAIQKNACNCLTVKINQIGSLTEAFEACRLAKDAGWDCIVAGRCGETADTFLADLAVGLGAGQLNAGAPCRGERMAKYNQILRIEEEVGSRNSRYGQGNFGATSGRQRGASFMSEGSVRKQRGKSLSLTTS